MPSALPGRSSRRFLDLVRVGAAVIAVALLPALAAPARADSASPTPSPSAAGSLSGAAATPGRVTFGIQPASVDAHGILAPDTRPYLYYAASPGSVVNDHVAVINYGLEPIVATVYSADARNDAQGGFTLLTGQQRSTDAGAWTSVSSHRVTVTVAGRTAVGNTQKYGFAILPISIRIPAGTSPGDHVGGVLVSVQTKAQNQQGANLLLDQRVGTRMFVRVSGALRPDVEVQDVHAQYLGSANPFSTGAADVSFTVSNSGNVKLGGRMVVEVSGLLGRSTSVTLPDLPLLLPGNSVQVSAHLSGVVPQVRDTATVTLTPLKLPGDADPSLPAVVGSTGFWAMPWVLLGLVLALVGGICWGIWFWRRPPAPAAPAPREPVRHAVPLG